MSERTLMAVSSWRIDAALLAGYADVHMFFRVQGISRQHLRQVCTEVSTRATVLLALRDAPHAGADSVGALAQQLAPPSVDALSDEARLDSLRAMAAALRRQLQ